MARVSSKSPDLDKPAMLFLAVSVAFSMAVYLWSASVTYRLGFPLDDAWIHQTYARNLVEYGQWAFYPGEVSGGSTAPLWSALLAIGHWLQLGPYVWTYLLGGLFSWLLAFLCERVARQIVHGYRPRVPWVGLFFVFEWHIVWATASGMETILHALLVTAVLGLLMAGWRRYVLFGLLVGLSVWVRPDGITLLGPLALTILVTSQNLRSIVGSFSRLLIGFGTLFIFYLLFNLWVAGTPWPNTFYAKQSEYAILLAQPLYERFMAQITLPLVGAGVILLPGAVGLGIRSVRQKDWAVIAVIIWLLGYIGLYAWRLPVTYQHGRYIMPAMPIFFLLGLVGYLYWFRSGLLPRYHWVINTTLKFSLVGVLALFWVLGARSYGQDVAVIESEMVDTAQWVSKNLPSTDLIAAHDIGALGYFARRPLVDLAGLVSPDVIPFIRDEARLASYLSERNVRYLITFPGWYPDLSTRYLLIYSTGATFAPQLGGENMAIFSILP